VVHQVCAFTDAPKPHLNDPAYKNKKLINQLVNKINIMDPHTTALGY